MIKLIKSQKNNFQISKKSKFEIFSKFIKNIQTKVKTIQVEISKIGYIGEIFWLQYLHFQKFFNQEKIGINSKLERVLLHFAQWLLQFKIHFSPDFNL